MLKLYRETGAGEFLTLAGTGIMVDLISQAIREVGANPNDVVLRINDGSSGASIHVMYPTPHTYLFDSVHIWKENLCFYLGGGSYSTKEEREKRLPLASPTIVKDIADSIRERAKSHKKTRTALKD